MSNDQSKNYGKYYTLSPFTISELQEINRQNYKNPYVKEWVKWAGFLEKQIGSMDEVSAEVIVKELQNCYENILKRMTDGESLNQLGDRYYWKERDFDKAVLYYKKAADLDNPDAINNMGNCYYNGYGVIKDEKTAVEYYKKAASKNNANGQFNLAYCYEFGIGTEIDKTAALELYFEAAKNGHKEAQRVVDDYVYYSRKDSKLSNYWNK